MDKKNQEIKRDAGKPELSLVPMTELLNAIAGVREYGTYVKGYGRESWREVSIERYIDALLRHVIAFADDPTGTDDESGLPHIDHVACNIAFLLELMKDELKEVRERISDFTHTEYDTLPKETYILPSGTISPDLRDQWASASDSDGVIYSASTMIHNDK